MPNVYSDTLSHDAVMVWLSPPTRDVVGGIQMRTAPPPSVGDDLTVTDPVTVVISMTPQVVDTQAESELAVVAMGIPVLAVDVGTPAEAVVARQSVLLAVGGDDLAPTDAVTLALPIPGVLAADAVGVGEGVDLRAALVAVDTLAPAESVTVQLPTGLSAVDTVGPTDAVALVLNVLTPAVGDDVGPVDMVQVIRPVTINVNDTEIVDERRFAAMAAPKKIKIHGRAVTR